MTVGDLVKFAENVRGYKNLVGIIIAENGEGFDVLWNKNIRNALLAAEGVFRGPRRKRDGQIQAELPEFLEVINDGR